MAKHLAIKALLACNSALILLVVLLLRKLRKKTGLNVFIDEVGHCRRSSSATNWTLKLVWSSGGNCRKELALASSALATCDATEKLDIAVQSKNGNMQLRGRAHEVDVDYYSGYICFNCQLFRRTAIGWRHMPTILNATRHHISLFSIRGYVGIAAMDAVKRDLEQLVPAHFVVGEPLARDGLPGFQTAMRISFEGDVLENLRAYAQINAHLISWYNSTEDGANLHICL